MVKYKIKQLLKPKKSQKQQNQRNLIQEQIQRTKNLREQNLKSQLAAGTIATVRFEEVKVKVSQRNIVVIWWLICIAPNNWWSVSCDSFVNRQLMKWLNRTVHIQLQYYQIITMHKQSYSRTLLVKGCLFFSVFIFHITGLEIGILNGPKYKVNFFHL